MFIAIDGVDCIGKDTIAEALCEAIDKKTKKALLLTRDPGDTERGNWARHQLQHAKKNLSVEEQVKLFNLSRQANIEENIYDMLERDNIVVINRYFYTTIAYQFMDETDVNIVKYSNDIIDAITYKGVRHIPDICIMLYSSDMDIIQKRLEDKKDKDDIEVKIIHRLSEANDLFKNMENNKAVEIIHGDKDTKFINIDVSKYVNRTDVLVNVLLNSINI